MLQEEECDENYRKSCYIAYEKQAFNETVKVIMRASSNQRPSISISFVQLEAAFQLLLLTSSPIRGSVLISVSQSEATVSTCHVPSDTAQELF